jgi:hypothetical protein
MKAVVWLLLIALIAVLLPVAINHHLRNVYRQTLAHWLSKAVPPPTVFIGDSITAGGQWFDDIRNINLGSNGLATYQIAGTLTVAQTYRPKRIVIMAGINDAVRGFDPDKIRDLWEKICKEPVITVTLVTPTKDDDLNRKIDQINNIIIEKCQGKPILKLDLADESGRLRSEFQLTGVSLGPKAYESWIAALGAKPNH